MSHRVYAIMNVHHHHRKKDVTWAWVDAAPIAKTSVALTNVLPNILVVLDFVMTYRAFNIHCVSANMTVRNASIDPFSLYFIMDNK